MTEAKVNTELKLKCPVCGEDVTVTVNLKVEAPNPSKTGVMPTVPKNDHLSCIGKAEVHSASKPLLVDPPKGEHPFGTKTNIPKIDIIMTDNEGYIYDVAKLSVFVNHNPRPIHTGIGRGIEATSEYTLMVTLTGNTDYVEAVQAKTGEGHLKTFTVSVYEEKEPGQTTRKVKESFEGCKLFTTDAASKVIGLKALKRVV